MKCPKMLAVLLACASLAAIPAMPAHAAINSMSLGASYDAQKTQITFRVYSSQATRIVLYLYASGYGAQEAATYQMSNQGGGVWQVIVPVSSIQGAGITGSVYYGYRAWGSELAVQLELDQGLFGRFHFRRRQQRQPLQPEQIAAGSVCA